MIIEAPPRCGLAGFALRPLRRADVAEWYAYLSIPEVIEHTSWDLRGPEDLERLVRRYEAPDPQSDIRFAIVEEGGGCLAGTIGFHSTSATHCSAELAYDLSPRYWGRGIATAVCAAVTGWSYGALGLQRVQATVLESNLRSERVLRRCGFSYEGLLRAYRLVRGLPGNFKMYARLAGDPRERAA
jgi:ribosomal-protein-alanine N-acetyltransferase